MGFCSNIVGQLVKTPPQTGVSGCTPLFEDWYIRTLLRTPLAGLENTNPLLKNLSRLPKKTLQPLTKVVGTQRKLAANVLYLPFKGLLSKSPCK